MANKKITELTEAASVAATDLLEVVADMGSAPVNKKVTFENLEDSISHANIADIGSNSHSTIDTFIGSKASASGLASLDGDSLVVQNPANATATPTANKIPIADGSGKLDGWVTAGTDKLSSVSADDTTPGYLDGKLVAGSDISLTVGSPAGNETLTIAYTGSAGADEKSKVSANDTTAGYLNGKLVAGEGIDFIEGSDGEDETLTILGEDATDSNKGIVELATVAETSGGSDTAKAVTPDSLGGSIYGTKTVILKVFEDATALTTGNGKMYFTCPSTLNGMNLVSVGAHVYTASSSGLPEVQIHNLTDTSDMLSTTITIDATEYDSKDATTPAVIDTAHDDVATGDVLRIDVDTAGTGAKGLEVRMEFRLP